MIRVEGLVKRYRKAKRNAVDGVDFEVEAGEFFALLGPNGAGKTTTLSILTTTLSPTAGRALIDGHDVVAEAAAVRRKVGIIFQRPNVASQRTANQIFPFVMLPQFFLAGVFNPIHDLPPVLAVLSALSPMRYAVELTRNAYYGTQAGLVSPATSPFALNVAVIVASFLGFVVIGTALFVRSERNR